MNDMFDLFKPLSMRLASNDERFALLVANEYVSAVNKSYQWLKHNQLDISQSEVNDFANIINEMRFTSNLEDDGKIRYVNDHLPKHTVDNRVWRMQGEHCILSMRLAKPQIGAGEIFTAGVINGAYLTNATKLKGDVVTTPRSIEIKDAGTQKISMDHMNSYIDHDLDILVFNSVSNKIKPQEAKRTRYKMFPAKDWHKHMYVAGDAVKFNSFMED